MILNSVSAETKANKLLKKTPAKKSEGNAAWLARAREENDFAGGGLILFGGNSVVDFRVRVAQSHLRRDLTPSYWSGVGVAASDDKEFYSVPLHWRGGLSEMPRSNGIQTCLIEDYDDPESFPNVAFIQFADRSEDILNYAERLKLQRSVVDLPALVVAWLEFVWGVGQKGNPLLSGQGLPGAVFAETIYGIAGIELTPGLSTASSCPEAVWQAAKWWSSFYSESSEIDSGTATRPIVPRGCFAVRQPSAAVSEKLFNTD